MVIGICSLQRMPSECLQISNPLKVFDILIPLTSSDPTP